MPTFFWVGLQCLFVLVAGIWSPAHAALTLDGTRVVFNAKENEASITVRNEGDVPLVMQAWIDSGDATASPSKANAPMIVLPPMSRVDQHQSQVLRIVSVDVGEALPADRESVFWLNVLGIPPKPASQDASVIQLAFRSRIKIFYRPAALAGTPENAPAGISWKLTPSQAGASLELHNGSAYHVTIEEIEVNMDGQKEVLSTPFMLAPQGDQKFSIKLSGAGKSGVVHFKYINDYGGVVSRDAKLAQ